MTREIPFPSFFIVGAPRCGTTTLSNVLGKHPQVCFSRPKETHFFSWLRSTSFGGDLSTEYLERFFSHFQPEHGVIGEGSTSYIFAPESVDRILEINPAARFIAMVRNPREMVLSYHSRLLYMLDESEENFATAWALQEQRARGEMMPKRCRDPRLLQYGQAARLGEQVSRLCDAAGRDQCMVIVYDDFAENPRKIYQEVLQFIGVEDDGRTEFPHKVSSCTYRSRKLHEWVYRGPTWSGRLLEQAARRQPTGKRHVKIKRARKRLLRMNTIAQSPRPIDTATRQQLAEVFAADIQRLSSLLGRDFSHWR